MSRRTESDFIRSVLHQVMAQARNSGLTPIRRINLVLGEIAELDRTILQTHWEEISKGTPAEQVQLHFRLMEAEVQCMSCFEKYHPEGGAIHCPYCGSFGAKVLAGEECYLESIE